MLHLLSTIINFRSIRRDKQKRILSDAVKVNLSGAPGLERKWQQASDESPTNKRRDTGVTSLDPPQPRNRGWSRKDPAESCL